MVAKYGEARRRAFLTALAQTGNQTLAAERAKVSRSWVRLHRTRDPAFAQACEQGLRRAKERLGGHGQRRPPSGWGFLKGEELVVKGNGGSGGGKRVQIARARLKQWSPRAEDRFLVVLGATCNVKLACAEVGLTPASAYNHRNRWPAFAKRWKAALQEGYWQLEAELLDVASNLFSNPRPAMPGPITGMTVSHAIELLRIRRWQEDADAGREWSP